VLVKGVPFAPSATRLAGVMFPRRQPAHIRRHPAFRFERLRQRRGDGSPLRAPVRRRSNSDQFSRPRHPLDRLAARGGVR